MIRISNVLTIFFFVSLFSIVGNAQERIIYKYVYQEEDSTLLELDLYNSGKIKIRDFLLMDSMIQDTLFGGPYNPDSFYNEYEYLIVKNDNYFCYLEEVYDLSFKYKKSYVIPFSTTCTNQPYGTIFNSIFLIPRSGEVSFVKLGEYEVLSQKIVGVEYIFDDCHNRGLRYKYSTRLVLDFRTKVPIIIESSTYYKTKQNGYILKEHRKIDLISIEKV